jgi:hypothetical protein
MSLEGTVLPAPGLDAPEEGFPAAVIETFDKRLAALADKWDDRLDSIEKNLETIKSMTDKINVMHAKVEADNLASLQAAQRHQKEKNEKAYYALRTASSRMGFHTYADEQDGRVTILIVAPPYTPGSPREWSSMAMFESLGNGEVGNLVSHTKECHLATPSSILECKLVFRNDHKITIVWL